MHPFLLGLLLAGSAGPVFANILDAARTGAVAAVEQALAADPGAWATADADGRTALHHAARTGQRDVVTLLLKQGAAINQADKAGLTPLYLAAQAGRAEIVQLLLDQGADARVSDPVTGMLPFHVAAFFCQDAVLGIFLKAQIPPEIPAVKDGTTALHIAARQGCTNAVARLLAAGAQPSTVNTQQISALGSAITAKQTAVVAQMLAAGADPNGPGGRGLTPLGLAVVVRAPAIVEQLLARGAEPNGKAIGTLSPLQRAALDGDERIVKALLAAKADMRHAGLDGRTALHLAAMRLRHLVVAELLAAGADPNQPDRTGYTPLLYVAFAGRDDIARLLVAHGAKWDPLSAAALGRETELTQLLHDEPALATKELLQTTPLHMAVRRKQPATVKLLLAAGANPDVKDSSQLSPREIATADGAAEILPLFSAPAQP
jgi:ankyrin repeat protein